MEVCGSCRGTGLTSEARLAARQGPAGDAKAAAFETFERMAKALKVEPDCQPVETPPTLAVVRDD